MSSLLSLFLLSLSLCCVITTTTATIPDQLDLSHINSHLPSTDILHKMVHTPHSLPSQQQQQQQQLVNVSNSCSIAITQLNNLSYPHQPLMFIFSGQSFDDLGDFDSCQQLTYAHHCSASFSVLNISVIMGLCIPKNCSQEDLLLSMPQLIGGSLGLLYYGLESINIINASTLITSCASQEMTWQHDTQAVIVVAIIMMFVILVMIATVMDHFLSVHDYNNELSHHHDLHDHTWHIIATPTHAALADLTHSLHPITQHEHDNNQHDYSHLQSDDMHDIEQQHHIQITPSIPAAWRQMITSFSAIRNMKKLLTPMPKSNVDMSCFNGVRVLSLVWVIMGHTLYYQFPLLKNGLYVITDVIPRISFAAVMGAFFAVDSFFFLSGFLGAYYLLPQLTTTRLSKLPKLLTGYYIHRYIRITPIYLVWLFWDWKVGKYMGSGQSPLHFQVLGWAKGNETGIEYEYASNPCDTYWWANLLYINNFVPSGHSDQCFPWSWYLANDMQFAIILPFLIYLYSRHRLAGIITLISLLTASMTYVGVIADVKGYSASMLDEKNFFGYYDDIYGKPYGRIQPFIMGILFALLLHVHPHRIPTHIYRFCMIIAAFLMASIIFGPSQLYDELHVIDHIINQDDISALTRDPWSMDTHHLYMATSRGMWGLGLGFFCYSMIVGKGEDAGFEENSKEPGSYVRAFLSHSIWTPLARLSYQAYLVHEIWINFYVHQLRAKPVYTDWSYVMNVIGHVGMAFVWATIGYIVIEKPIMNLTNWLLNTIAGKPQKNTENNE